MGIFLSTLMNFIPWFLKRNQNDGNGNGNESEEDEQRKSWSGDRSTSRREGFGSHSASTFPILNILLAQVSEQMKPEDFLCQLNECDSHAEQIQLVKIFFNGTPGSPHLRQMFGKSSAISTEYHENVTTALFRGYLKVAEQNCQLAFAYAETDEDLAKCHISKAKLLHIYKDFDGAIENIKQSLDILSSSSFKSSSSGKSLVKENLKLKTKVETDREREKSTKADQNSRDDQKKRRKFRNELFQLKSPNPQSPSLEDFVSIKFNEARGRHLVVNKEIPVGTTLLVEKPFVLGLNGTLEMDSSHCHHCLKSLTSKCVPCPTCVFALFCDEKCLTAALSTYHKFECPCLPHLRSVLTNQKEFDGVNFHLAFKLISTVGPQKLHKLFKQQKELEKFGKSNSSFFAQSFTSAENIEISGKGGCERKPEQKQNKEHASIFNSSFPVPNPTLENSQIYSPSSYLCILHLNSVFKSQCQIPGQKKVEKRRKRRQEPCLPLVALILSRILDANTDFFHIVEKENEDENENANDNDKTEEESQNNSDSDSGVDESSPLEPTKILKNQSPKSEFQDFIAQLILHHFHCIRNNVFSIWEMEFPLDHDFNSSNSDSDAEENDPEENRIDPGRLEYEMNLYGRGLYPTASLMNHSCDPNVMMFHSGGGEIAIATVKALKPGEEVLIFYSPPFSDQPKDERRRRLDRIYNFECECVACENDWPMTGQRKNPKKFVCHRCMNKLSNEEKSVEKIESIVICLENGFKCPSCKEQYRQRDLLEKLQRHKQIVYKSLRMVNSNRPIQAMSGLKNSMEFFQNNIEPPFELQSLVQKFFITAIQLILHFSK